MTKKNKTNPAFLWLATLVAASSLATAAPGIDPKHKSLNNSIKNKMYKKCREDPKSKDTIDGCEKAMLYEFHLKRNIHKGLGWADFGTKAGVYLTALNNAEKETGLFEPIQFNTDTSTMNAIQANMNAFSSSYEMMNGVEKLSESIDEYRSIMKNITKQTLTQFKIENAITQLLYEEEMAKEIKKFNEGK